ncbi:MAG: hypothetical protein EHM49_08375 [Deltaproteobacteria bacterium]|nr:MAG: hypothetical protein EHM49_08375 [Deltaproteobacteria bacterium]
MSRRFAQMNADQDKETRDARKCGTWVHYEVMNREGAKYAKGYIFFMIRTDDHEKRNAIHSASQLWPPPPGGHMSHVLPGVLCVLSAAGGWVTDLFEPRRRPSIISQEEDGGQMTISQGKEIGDQRSGEY